VSRPYAAESARVNEAQSAGCFCACHYFRAGTVRNRPGIWLDSPVPGFTVLDVGYDMFVQRLEHGARAEH